MTTPSTASLHYDLRFRGAPLELRGLYRMLLDYQDAAGDVLARGVDGVGATAAALGCAREEAATVLARLAAHGLVRHEDDRVCLLVGSRRGKRGGMSGAERARKLRAEGAPRNGNVTSEPRETTAETANRNGISAAPSAPAAEPRNGNVTSEPRETTAETANRNGISAGHPAPAALPPSAPRVLPLPHPPPLTPPASAPPAPAGGVGAGAPTAVAVQGSLFGEPEASPTPTPKSKAPKPRPANAPPPLPFKLGEALDQLAAASVGRFVRGEGRDIAQSVAIAITAQIRAYPTLGEWEVCGAWLAAGALAFRGTLAPSWVASTDFRNAMALARDWDAKGRPPVDRRDAVDGAKRSAANDPQRARSPPTPPARRRVGPAAVSTAADFARELDLPDPLLSLLDTAT